MYCTNAELMTLNFFVMSVVCFYKLIGISK